ncbi:translocation/assembly module TamB domain-containing protein [Sphingomonas colocasiae]|uniref:Translocation/assembly module TamB domain-containing protein n=1 Tax=Sphingomonas colocasiae TaxID=1848973 RepID=A0ABS7PWJ5_9SPHN|nr:translocation/assembly module TamB domain-containing protein [Sphingomonas colocasiae]MBY8825732.1 translocation/assembly module TamB domain-containing protein [Sphingomonas colocasiae]
MAEAGDTLAVRPQRPLGLRIAIWAGIALLSLVLLAIAAIFALDTAPGRRFVLNQLDGYELESGLKVNIGRLDGSLYGALVIRDLRLSDTRGVFATAPRIDLDWRPFAFLKSHVDVRSATAGLVTLARLPELKAVPSDPDAPILPDLDIDIGRLKVDRLVLGPAVAGERRVISLGGKAEIADRRARITANAAAAGTGDRLAVLLDAVPDDNRLVIDARLAAPVGGVVATMAGLTKPLDARIAGRGSWADWKGRIDAALGGQPLAAIDMTARNGSFDLRGPLRPGLILQGPVDRLTAPALMLELATKLEERRADTRLSLRSPALAVSANGVLDLGRSRFGGMKVDARLLTPGAIAENLNGRDIQAALVLDGAFAAPVVDYRIRAAAIGFGDTVVEGLSAQGRSRVDANRILVPVSARIARVTGLNAAAGGMLVNVAIDGDFAVQGDSIMSDNLRIRSRQIDATAIVIADLSTGIYRGALNGRVNDYRIEGVGIVNLTTDIKLVTVPSGGFGMQGRFGLATVRIDNASAAEFLGGRTVMAGNLRFDPAGIFSVDNLRVNAPRFRLAGGRGSNRPDGRIAFVAQGMSNQYGPLALDIWGTVERPLVRLRAARPNVGVQLSDVEAIIRGTGAGYAVTATGGSPYGPFNADIVVRTAAGPLTIDINRARFAGVDFAGTVRQLAAGPFAGRLTASGSGITGVVTLGAVGKYQSALVSARANGAHIPGQAGLVIDRAIIEARAILYETPEVIADVQLAGVRQGDLLIQTARAKINYRGGRGTAQLVASGRSGASFRVAANAQLSPDLYRVAAQGQIGAVPFRLAQPAVIRGEGGGYRLLPVAVVVPQGQMRIAGRYGAALEAQARFQNFDLSVLNGFAPGAGVGGRATGGLDFVQASGEAMPRADLRLTIDDFTRSGAAIVSTPVDISAQGALRPEGGSIAAIIRRGGAAIGRAQFRLQPSGGGAWTSALASGAVSGGIRYNGPADVLWSLTGIADQQLSGPVGVAADVSGTLGQPRAVGVVRANALAYENETYGTRISAIRLNGRFTNDRLEITEFNGRAGNGTVTAQGSIGFAANSGFPIDLRATLTNARLAESDALSARVSGDIAVTNDARGAFIRGTLRLPEVRYQIIRQGGAEIAELEGVRRKGTSRAQAAQQAAAAGPPGLFKLDLNIRAEERLYVSGMGLESEWGANLRVGGTSSAPVVTGVVDLVRGTYSFAGRRFDLSDASVVRFEGGQATNPSLEISATADIQGTAVTINIGGRALNPQIAFTSSPSLPQDELLSRILFGNSVTELSAMQAIQLASALNGLRASGGGLNPLGKLRSATGIDRLRVLGADEATGRGTAVAAGQYISNDIYVEIITDTKGFTATQLEIALSKALSILSQTGGSNGTAVKLRYSKDY